jgi:hypothetical protein
MTPKHWFGKWREDAQPALHRALGHPRYDASKLTEGRPTISQGKTFQTNTNLVLKGYLHDETLEYE